VHGFLEGVEAENLDGGSRSGLEGPGLPLVGQEPGHGLQRQLPQPLALAQEPLLEGRLDEGEAAQEISRVELRRLRQRLDIDDLAAIELIARDVIPAVS
jgi:hypothetical protein